MLSKPRSALRNEQRIRIRHGGVSRAFRILIEELPGRRDLDDRLLGPLRGTTIAPQEPNSPSIMPHYTPRISVHHGLEAVDVGIDVRDADLPPLLLGSRIPLKDCNSGSNAASQAALDRGSTRRLSATMDSLTSSDSDETDDETDIFMHPFSERTRPTRRTLASLQDELAETTISRISSRVLQGGVSRKRAVDDPSASPAKRRRSGPSDDESVSGKSLGSFVCPYYLRKPTEHQSCLRSDLRRIIDVKRHLWAAHRLPYHCPVCGTVFRIADGWEHHIRTSRCTRREFPELEGVSEDQVEKLAVAPVPGESDEDHWFSIWDTVLPGVTERPSHPFLPNIEPSRSVGLLRAFWKRKGEGVVRSFLDSKGIDDCGRGRASRDLKVFQASVLDQMIEKLLVDFNEKAEQGARA